MCDNFFIINPTFEMQKLRYKDNKYISQDHKIK